MRSRSADHLRSGPPAGLALAGGVLAVAMLLVAAIAFSEVARVGKKSNVAGGKRVARGQVISGPPATPYQLSYPAGWRRVPKGQLQKVRSTPAAAIRRADGRGLVTLTVRGPITTPLEELATGFRDALAERFDDFELVTSTQMQVEAGVGIYTSWILRDEGRVQGNLTVPVGAQSYTLDAALPTGATDVAREVGAIFGTFDVTPSP